jgi:hypothetical protein
MRRPLLANVATPLLAAAFATMQLRAQAPSDRDLARACEDALQSQATADAKAEGLSPGLFPFSFDGAKSKTTRAAGSATVSGTADYRPVTDAPAFAVHFSCVVDTRTSAVGSASYAVLTSAGAASPTRPALRVRQAIVVDQCQDALESKVWDEASKKGLSENTTDAELDLDGAAFATKGTTTDVSGRGRVRLSKDYEWQAVTFTCRYDEKKKEASRAAYAIDRTVAAPALSPEKSRALETCHAAIEDDVLQEAISRGYRSLRRVRVDLKPGAEFATAGRDLDVRGRGQFKLDERHPVATGMSFTCRVDPATQRIVSTKIDVAESSWTQTGDVAGTRMGTLVCESTPKVQKVCAANIKGSVKIVRETRGSTGCKAYENWIWSLSGITVWGGCRAEFEFEEK